MGDTCIDTMDGNRNLQKLVLDELMEAVYLSRSAAIVIGKSESTSKYREIALEDIYKHLSFAVPHILSHFHDSGYEAAKQPEHSLLFAASVALDDKAMSTR